ncbi:MAG: hypothetical protein HZA61_09125 [Candidatus Eisenbacteria bacterium]|uniref:T9SS type A sorting domain-containing protein n=1 Tax=Eiseniibacteriota bacterium TaxID=2212470 RepID=A0A933SBU4_UNCEI|nr:hypothetical protein [Candidatus Eisenbacteria bacterium]
MTSLRVLRTPPAPRRALPALVRAALLVWGLTSNAHADPVRAVLMTHIEDNTPAGTLGTLQARTSYVTNRTALLNMARLCDSLDVQWTLQPDWKFLEAALIYEDATLTSGTGGKNVLRYLAENRGVRIDPHSHENGGYNYTDVAHLLDSLGVGGSTVIGGHIWDPALPQFQEWDRFRRPVRGQRYPGALWRGDQLIGAGTPNHVNDPRVSGMWRPWNRDHYFVDAPDSNMIASGAYGTLVADLAELIAYQRAGIVPAGRLLTWNTNLRPNVLTAPGGLAALADTVLTPLRAWRDSGLVVLTDFHALRDTWLTQYGGEGWMFDAAAAGVLDAAPGVPFRGGVSLAPCAPNPARARTTVRFTLGVPGRVRLGVSDVLGRRVAVLAEGDYAAGTHAVDWAIGPKAPGMYFVTLETLAAPRIRRTTRLLVVR